MEKSNLLFEVLPKTKASGDCCQVIANCSGYLNGGIWQNEDLGEDVLRGGEYEEDLEKMFKGSFDGSDKNRTDVYENL